MKLALFKHQFLGGQNESMNLHQENSRAEIRTWGSWVLMHVCYLLCYATLLIKTSLKSSLRKAFAMRLLQNYITRGPKLNLRPVIYVIKITT